MVVVVVVVVVMVAAAVGCLTPSNMLVSLGDGSAQTINYCTYHQAEIEVATQNFLSQSQGRICP